MSTRKTTQDAKTAPGIVPTADRSRKKAARSAVGAGKGGAGKARGPRVRLTHFEVRRGETLRLKIAVADDALAEAGDELGALIKRIAPSTRTAVAVPESDLLATRGEDFVVSRAHVEHDASYHAELREHLVDLFSSFCDDALEDALDVARQERDRRSEGEN